MRSSGWELPLLLLAVLALGLSLFSTPSAVAVSTVTLPISVSVAAYGPPAVGTLSGCSVSPSSIAFDGAVHYFTATPGCKVAISVPPDGSQTRYRFGFQTTARFTTCSYGTCAAIHRWVYFELLNTYVARANAQSEFDGSLVFTVTGFLGPATMVVPVCSMVTASTDTAASCSGWSDSGLPVTMPAHAANQQARTRWVLSGTASFTDATGGITHSSDYYKQLKESVSYGVVPIMRGGYSAPTLTYTSLGSPATRVLGPGARVLWLDYGSSWSTTNPLPGSGSAQRWMAGSGVSGVAAVPGTIRPRYYLQFNDTFTFRTSDSAVPPAPSVSYRQFGIMVARTVPSTGVSDWIDAGSRPAYQAFLSGTSSTERWARGAPAVLSGLSKTFSPTYFHQFMVTFGYSTSDSSQIGYYNSGSGYQITSGIAIGYYYQRATAPLPIISFNGTVTPASDWVQAGSAKVIFVSATSPAGNQRWALPSVQSFDVTSSGTITETGYYHQFRDSLQYTVVGGGSPAPPTVDFTSLGSAASLAASNTTAAYAWIDSGSTVTYPATITDGTYTWTTTTTTFTTSSSTVFDPAYSK